MQNGLLLRNDIHDLFDSYDVSINPDVCLYRGCLLNFSATNDGRTITKLFTLGTIIMTSQANTFMTGSAISPKCPPSTFFAGIFSKLYWQI